MFLTKRYVGIKPPPKIIVKVKIHTKIFFPTKPFLANGYAPVNVSTRLINVPNPVYMNEFKNPFSRSWFVIMFLYPSSEKLTGQKRTFPEITLAGELNDCATTFNSGNSTKAKQRNKKILIIILNTLSPEDNNCLFLDISFPPFYHKLVSEYFLAKKLTV
jgi:hypothetical protein